VGRGPCCFCALHDFVTNLALGSCFGVLLRITKSLKCAARRTYFSVAYLLMVSSIHNSGKYNKLDTYTNLGVQCSPWEHPSFGFFPQLL